MTTTPLPEPAVQASSIIPRNGIYGPLYTADQLRAYAAAECAARDAYWQKRYDELEKEKDAIEQRLRDIT